jgi:hypothetical protein
VADIAQISSSEYAIDGNLSRFAWMPQSGYPFSPGHFESSITYRDGLTALPGHGQLVDMR